MVLLNLEAQEIMNGGESLRILRGDFQATASFSRASVCTSPQGAPPESRSSRICESSWRVKPTASAHWINFMRAIVSPGNPRYPFAERIAGDAKKGHVRVFLNGKYKVWKRLQGQADSFGLGLVALTLSEISGERRILNGGRPTLGGNAEDAGFVGVEIEIPEFSGARRERVASDAAGIVGLAWRVVQRVIR